LITIHQKPAGAPVHRAYPIGVAKVLLKTVADGVNDVTVNLAPPAKPPNLADIPNEWGTVTLTFTATPIEEQKDQAV
jgi:hypothetical protein